MDPFTGLLFGLALMVAGSVAQALTQPRPSKPTPAAFGDFTFPSPEEGTAQAVIFGDCWTQDWSVLWYGNYRTTPIKSTASAK